MARSLLQPPSNRPSGFTLLELLVVMTIIVIILAMIGLNISVEDDGELRVEAARLALLAQTAQEEAILSDNIIVLSLAADGYHFYQLVYRQGTPALQPIEGDEALRQRHLPNDMELTRDSNLEIPETKHAWIFFYPNGLFDEFELILTFHENQWLVRGNMQKGIRALDASLAEAA